MSRLGSSVLLLAFLWSATAGNAATSVSAAAASTSFRNPGAGEKLTAGAALIVRWRLDGIDREDDVEEMELLLSFDGGVTYPLRVTKELSPDSRELSWRVPNFPTHHARLALRTGSREHGEVIRAESPEFEILAADALPLERFRIHLAEWWTADALEERANASAFPDGLGISPPSETISAPGGDEPFEKPPAPALRQEPGESAETVEPAPLAPVAPLFSLRFPLNLPKRE